MILDFEERIEGYEMVSILNEINSQGIFTIILCVVLVLLLIVEGTKLWKGTLESLDLKSGKELRENAINERIDELEHKITSVENSFMNNQEVYHNQSIEIRNHLQDNQENLSNQITELNQMMNKLNDNFVKKEISDMRTTLLDFANAIMNDRDYNREQYEHILDVYQDYENVLKENHMDNGRVTRSMEYVKKNYDYLIEHGFKK